MNCWVLPILSNWRDGKGGKWERRGGSRDTKTDGLREKENSTHESNICPLFCIIMLRLSDWT